MTRINADLNPKVLTDQHLLAEYNEIGMFFSSLRRSLKSKNGICDIPENFTLNSGHVKFFYNKLSFVIERYHRLIVELKNRGFNLDPNRVIFIDNEFPQELYNNWEMDNKAKSIIIDRIIDKINKKPQWYRYYKNYLPSEYFSSILMKG